MSANIYTIESLLVGKTYRSKTLQGEILSAEKSNLWTGHDSEAYLVEVRKPASIHTAYRIVAVKV